MIKVAITGANGFVGMHMLFRINEFKGNFEVVCIEKQDFFDVEKLSKKISGSSFVLHFAGLNRGEDDEIYKTNVGLTEKILYACDSLKSKPKIIFLSSTHNTRDTAYGRSKKDSEKLVLDWGVLNKVETTSIVSTNIFGEFCKPNYNSFIATFCDDILSGKDSVVNKEVNVNLVYVGEISSLILNLIKSSSIDAKYELMGKQVNIGDVYSKLKSFNDSYLTGFIPSLVGDFELRLFNTFRSYLYPDHFPIPLDLKTDNRGSFVEVVKEKMGGQSSFSTTHPKVIRGNHYHTRKIERFCVLSGLASIKLRKIFSDEIIEYRVSGDKPVYVDMPTFYTHSIENIGDTELLTMFWINEFYDPNDSDTFMESVVK